MVHKLAAKVRHYLTKTIWVVIPVFVFFILMPNFITQPKAEGGLVLGAEVKAQPTDTENNSAPVVTEIKKVTTNPNPTLSAKAVLVFDLTTGQVLYTKNSDEKLQIASLTKIMTAIVALDDPEFDKPITITSADQIAVSPELYLKLGDVVYPKNLLFAMLIGSANDAALTLGNHFPDQEQFLARMNAKAQEYGMISTSFNDPKGFDNAENYSTATDLYRLVNYGLRELPYDDIWKTKNYSFISKLGYKYYIRNSNSLVFKDANIKSIKTGLTPLALGNMIVKADDPNGHEIVTIILNSENREADTETLVKYTFDNYQWPK